MEQEADIVRSVKAGKRHAEKYLLRCVVCGKEYIRYKSQMKNGHGRYCSRKCAGIHMNPSGTDSPKWVRVARTCGICREEFYAQPSLIAGGRAKYCSRKCADEAKIGQEHPKGPDSPFWNRIVCICRYCGVEFNTRPSRIAAGGGIFCSRECHHKGVTGKLSPLWIGGISPYPPEFNEKLRKEIRERDFFTCQLCGMQEVESLIVFNRILDIHHIDYRKENSSSENLIALCHSCNARINSFRSHWTYFFTLKLEERGIETTVLPPEILQMELAFK